MIKRFVKREIRRFIIRPLEERIYRMIFHSVWVAAIIYVYHWVKQNLFS